MIQNMLNNILISFSPFLVQASMQKQNTKIIGFQRSNCKSFYFSPNNIEIISKPIQNWSIFRAADCYNQSSLQLTTKNCINSEKMVMYKGQIFSMRILFINISLQLSKSMNETPLTISGQSIKRMKMVAEGNFSQVYFAQTSSGKTAAVKKVKKSVKDKTSYQLAKKEAVILNGLDSTSVTRLIGTHQEHNYFYLIERYQQGQSLQSILKKKKKLPISDCQKVFRGILIGLEYLISKNIMHRDLKPANIMLDQKYRVVIVDFGFACKIGNDDSLCLTERIGTPFYMSPQMLNRKKYNSKSDIWSLGIIYYQMLYGSLPFYGINDGELYKDIVTNRQKLFKSQRNIPDSIKNIVNRCLTIDIYKRITWAQLFGNQKSSNQSSPLKASNFKRKDIIYEDDSVFLNCCTFF